MADPISTNLMSNTCGEVISSNCVAWAGPAVPGICKGASLTDVLVQVSNTASSAGGCCEGTFPTGNVSGYTGKWVDFSSLIPSSGGIPGQYAWTISNFGVNFSYTAGVGTGPENTPSYMWTPQGDLKVRGSFLFAINPLIEQGGIVPIPLVSLPIVNFPSGFTASQTKFITTSASCGYPLQIKPYVQQATRAFLTLDYPSGILYLNYSFVDPPMSNITEGIFMGGTTFNLA